MLLWPRGFEKDNYPEQKLLVRPRGVDHISEKWTDCSWNEIYLFCDKDSFQLYKQGQFLFVKNQFLLEFLLHSSQKVMLK